MQEDVIYRCINPACARPMPRRVNFCPWCGTAQGQAVPRPEPAPSPGREAAVAAAAGAGAEAVAAMSGWTEVPLPPEVEAPPARAGDAAATAKPANAAANAAANASANAPATPGTFAARPDPDKTGAPGPAAPGAGGFGHSWGRGGNSVPPHQEVPRPPIPARPKQRRPVQLRWWILALAILWGVWLWAKPSTRKIDERIDRAVALARECKGNEAQAELIALQTSRATPAQLQKLQKSLNEEAATCTRRRQRNKAWSEASAAAEQALDAGSVDKARTRLQGFIRRWGEDGKTRALKEKIDAAADRRHPLAVPPGQAAARLPHPYYS